MSNEKFTKGTWVLRDNCIGVLDESDTQSYGMINAICYIDKYDLVEWKDNARLIKTAHKMYALLKDILLNYEAGLRIDTQIEELLSEINQ